MSSYVVYVGDGHNNFTYGKKYRVMSNLHTTSSFYYINVIDNLGESQIVPTDGEEEITNYKFSTRRYGPATKKVEYFITIEEFRDRKLNELL